MENAQHDRLGHIVPVTSRTRALSLSLFPNVLNGGHATKRGYCVLLNQILSVREPAIATKPSCAMIIIFDIRSELDPRQMRSNFFSLPQLLIVRVCPKIAHIERCAARPCDYANKVDCPT
jgi:hypothetical protein